jgi:peroxiredoxin
MMHEDGRTARFMARSLVAALSLATTLGAAGCDSKKGVRAGDTAPDFATPGIHGETIRLSRYKGKIVVLYFWTNSCCGDNLKLVEPVYARNREKGLEILAIDVGDSREAIAAYARDNGLTFPLLIDEQTKIFRNYRLVGFPSIFLIDGHGIVRQVVLGDIRPADLERLVQRQFAIQKEADAAYEKLHAR